MPSNAALMSMCRSQARARTRARAALIALMMALSTAGVAAPDTQQSAPNTLDPQDARTTPSLVEKQQQRYHELSDGVWNAPAIPGGLPDAVRKPTARDSGTRGVGMEVHNVDYELADGVGFYIKSLKGMLVPHDASDPVNFDNPDEYDIHIYSGTVVVRPSDLDALFNHYILTDEPRALSRVSNKTSKDTLEVTVGARLFKFIPPVGGMPTTLSGPMTVSQDNKLVYTPDSVSSLGLPLLGPLKATGMSLSTITPLKRRGVVLDDNQLIMDPQTIFPPPILNIDKIDSATLSDAGLTLVFSSPHGTPDFSPPPVDSDSYIWMQSGDARFYGTVLVNTRLMVLNNSGKRLHFNLYHYRGQTAAGRINGLMDGTLVVRVPNEFDHQMDDSPTNTENAPMKKQAAD